MSFDKNKLRLVIKKQDPWIYILLVAICLILSILTAVHLSRIFVEYKELLYPLPPKGYENEQYAKEQAVPEYFDASVLVASDNAKSINNKSSKEENNARIAAVAEFTKNKRDLNAQEGMWRAANFLVVLTMFQIFIGAITAWYLVRTFRTQREELEQAERATDAAESAQAAYLMIEPVCELNEDDRTTFKFFFQIRNYGKSPAINTDPNFRNSRENEFGHKTITYFSGGFIIEEGKSHIIKRSTVQGRIADYLDISGQGASRSLEGVGNCSFRDIFGVTRYAPTINYAIEFVFTEDRPNVWQKAGLAEENFPATIKELILMNPDEDINSIIANNIKSVRVNIGYPHAKDESKSTK